MDRPKRCRWHLLCLLLLLAPFVLAKKAPNKPTVKDAAAEVHSESLGSASQWSQRDSEPLSQTKSDTFEALALLRTLETSSGRFSALDKRSGLVGSAAHYAKKAFVLLFMNGPSQQAGAGDDQAKLSKPLSKAVGLLEGAARHNESDALFLLAEMNFHGNFTHPRNYKHAFDYYKRLADLNGNSTAQHMVGFIYATGIGGAVERDQARALIYYTFAAKQDNTRAEMATAFRHHAGIGTPRNCQEAVTYYKRVADKAIEFARAGPPGGQSLLREAYHIADDDGGVYGEGASYSSSGHNAPRGGPSSDQNADFDDVMEYLDLMSRKGDLKATFHLGRIHYDGSRTVRRNFKTARYYFMQVARQYWSKDDSIVSEDNVGLGKLASKAAAYLGRFHLRGEGVAQNYDRALRWFRLGVRNGDAYCQYELGLMHLQGLGVKKDVLAASNYFKEAAQQDWSAAQVNLGKLFLDQGDLKTAISYFDLALRHGHIEAYYHLADVNNFGIGRERSCGLASAYYKIVAEKTEALHSAFGDANDAYESGDIPTALAAYMLAAEQGYEQAQANVAYMLDEHKSILSLSTLLRPFGVGAAAVASSTSSAATALRNAALALVYWTRSAKQANVDSAVKVGDYYLNGFGVEADVDRAALCYQAAAEMQQSAQALWNLGWMHENGIGVQQDFHLAKRFYDQAADTNSESTLPVKLALLKLRARSWWNEVTDGPVNSIQPEPEKPKRHRSWSEWVSDFLDADENGDWYWYDEADFAGAHDDNPMPGGDDFYYDDLDAATVETLMMLGLAGLLAVLVYYRQLRQQVPVRPPGQDQQQQREGEDEDDLPGQQPDGGFFPPPDDPFFDAWRVGGIGH